MSEAHRAIDEVEELLDALDGRLAAVRRAAGATEILDELQQIVTEIRTILDNGQAGVSRGDPRPMIS